VIHDASALLALINSEPGWEDRRRAFWGNSQMVKLAEAVTKMIDICTLEDHAWVEAAGLIPLVTDFSRELARATVALRRATRPVDLSLGDQVCLALAQQLQLPALTVDAAWQRLPLSGVELRVLR